MGTFFLTDKLPDKIRLAIMIYVYALKVKQ